MKYLLLITMIMCLGLSQDKKDIVKDVNEEITDGVQDRVLLHVKTAIYIVDDLQQSSYEQNIENEQVEEDQENQNVSSDEFTFREDVAIDSGEVSKTNMRIIGGDLIIHGTINGVADRTPGDQPHDSRLEAVLFGEFDQHPAHHPQSDDGETGKDQHGAAPPGPHAKGRALVLVVYKLKESGDDRNRALPDLDVLVDPVLCGLVDNDAQCGHHTKDCIFARQRVLHGGQHALRAQLPNDFQERWRVTGREQLVGGLKPGRRLEAVMTWTARRMWTAGPQASKA